MGPGLFNMAEDGAGGQQISNNIRYHLSGDNMYFAMKIKYFHTTRIHLAVRLHCKINNEKHYCQHANTLDFRQQSLKHTYITSSLLSFPQEMNPCFCYYFV